MQYSISAFFLKEVSDIDVYEKLEELQEKALHDDTIRKTLLKTREEKEPILAFCKQCQELGYEIYPMELINAGEEFYATMRRSTNGGGENSPKLSGAGMTLIREAKEKYPGTQFVILSGYAEFEYAETAIELGVKSYLLKPISNDELKRVMRKLFETLEKERQMEVEIFRKHQLETEQKGWLQEKAVNHLWQDNAAFLTEEEAAQLKSTCPELWKKEKGSLYLVVINIDAKSYEGKKISA